MRLSELAGLAVADLDLRGREAIVTGKGSKQRIVKFSYDTARALDRYLRERERHALARSARPWLGIRNRPPCMAGRVVRRLGRADDAPYTHGQASSRCGESHSRCALAGRRAAPASCRSRSRSASCARPPVLGLAVRGRCRARLGCAAAVGRAVLGKLPVGLGLGELRRRREGLHDSAAPIQTSEEITPGVHCPCPQGKGK